MNADIVTPKISFAAERSVALGLLTLPIINSTLTENEAVGQPPTVSRADSRTGRKTQTGRH
jgi:hypothetical protein